MIYYNKLVRDHIPAIIAKKGGSVTFRALQGDELKKALKDKLIEEAQEFVNAETPEDMIEEMADLLEVLDAALSVFHLGVTGERVKLIRCAKRKEKGGFARGYFLESVGDEE